MGLTFEQLDSFLVRNDNRLKSFDAQQKLLTITFQILEIELNRFQFHLKKMALKKLFTSRVAIVELVVIDSAIDQSNQSTFSKTLISYSTHTYGEWICIQID